MNIDNLISNLELKCVEQIEKVEERASQQLKEAKAKHDLAMKVLRSDVELNMKTMTDKITQLTTELTTLKYFTMKFAQNSMPSTSMPESSPVSLRSPISLARSCPSVEPIEVDPVEVLSVASDSDIERIPIPRAREENEEEEEVGEEGLNGTDAIESIRNIINESRLTLQASLKRKRDLPEVYAQELEDGYLAIEPEEFTILKQQYKGPPRLVTIGSSSCTVEHVIGIDKLAPPEFGEIVPVGTTFSSWAELFFRRVHCMKRSSVAGPTEGGAQSLCLSSKVKGHLDEGDRLSYTASRLQGVKRNSIADEASRARYEQLNHMVPRGARLLRKSLETGKLIRLIRSKSGPAAHAPKESFRYDGMYRVTQWWIEVGAGGLDIIKFRLVRDGVADDDFVHGGRVDESVFSSNSQ